MTFTKRDNIIKATFLIVKYIRDEMEDFHCDHLSDDQMKELNPIIRQALFNIFMFWEISQTPEDTEYKLAAKDLLCGTKQTIPDYWELPDTEAPWKELDMIIDMRERARLM